MIGTYHLSSSSKLTKILKNRDNYIYLILGLALVLRLGAFSSFKPWEEGVEKNFILHADANLYHDFALNILELKYTLSDRVSPGFPLLLSLTYSIFGITPWIVLLLNIVFNLICIFLVFQTAKTIFNGKIAILASSFMSLDIHQIVFTQTLLTDTSFTLLIVASFYFLVKYLKERGIQFLFYSGVILALAVLFRPIGVYLYQFVGILILSIPKFSFKEKFRGTLVFIAAYLLILAPVLGINYANFGHFGISRLGGLNYLYVNAMSVYEIQGNLSHEESIKLVNKRVKEFGGDSITNPAEREQLYLTVGSQIIKENLSSYLVNHINGSVNIFTSLSTYNIARVFGTRPILQSDKFFGYPTYMQIGSFINKKPPLMLIISAVLILIFLIYYSGAAIGYYLLLRTHKLIELLVLSLPIIYFTIVAGVVGNAQFKLPISPFLFMLTAYGIVQVYDKWKEMKQKKQNDNTNSELEIRL